MSGDIHLFCTQLADICKKQDIHFTYLGTGCIFTFDETHPYEQEVNGFDFLT